MHAPSTDLVGSSSAERDHIRKRSFDVFLLYLTDSATASNWWSAVIVTAGSKAQSELYGSRSVIAPSADTYRATSPGTLSRTRKAATLAAAGPPSWHFRSWASPTRPGGVTIES
jgi:hypothetical protein